MEMERKKLFGKKRNRRFCVSVQYMNNRRSYIKRHELHVTKNHLYYLRQWISLLIQQKKTCADRDRYRDGVNEK